MTEKEIRDLYNSVYQEVATNLSNAVGMALQVAQDSIHHSINKNFRGASLAVAPQPTQPEPSKDNVVPIKSEEKL